MAKSMREKIAEIRFRCTKGIKTGKECDFSNCGICAACSYIDYDYDRLEALFTAETAAMREALRWCSGSADFQEGGQARKGWLKICKPLL